MDGTVRRKCVLAVVSVAALCLFVMTAGSGCQTAGTVVSDSQAMECPACHEKIVTSSVKGVNFKTYTCPTCHKEYEADASGGYLPPKEVLVCPDCGEVVMECPTCKAKHGT